MTKEIYQAMRQRVSIIPTTHDYFAKGLIIFRPDYPVTYKVDLTGLDEDIPAFIQSMRTRNIWNVCQHFYSILKWTIGKDLDSLLLKNTK